MQYNIFKREVFIMLNSVSIGNALNSLVPISRFNKGEANKIFDEVKDMGYKIVVKNNTPACVLVDPQKYQEMVEIIEDFYLLQIVEERAKSGSKTFSQTEIMKEFNITDDDLQETEVEFE
jgi:PHD/YefM family antitoxin component YafN of YafNO toxin-antitoxin module